MYDLAIKGGTVVLPSNVVQMDVAVADGRIAALVGHDEPAMDAHRVIDARGKLVIPGGIDPHVHCDWPSGAGKGAGPEVLSRAALHGGTTTLIDFVTPAPGETLCEAAQRVDRHWAKTSLCDYSHHIILDGSADRKTLMQVPEVVAHGYPSIKIFTTNVRPTVHGRKFDMGLVPELMRTLAEAGGILAVHAEDDDVVMSNYARLCEEGKDSFVNVHLMHDRLSELLAVSRIVKMAEFIGGVRVYFMHLSTAEAVQLVGETRAKGNAVFAETLPNYALRTCADYRLPDGQIYHTYPSLKEQTDNDALWQGASSNVVHTVATDCVPRSFADKVRGHRIDDVNGGSVGVETRISVMYTRYVRELGMDLCNFVNLVSTNAAKILGMYPAKGVLLPGSDADITILETENPRVITASDLHEVDYSPWEGKEVWGQTVCTVLRGQVVVEDGVYVAGEQHHGMRVHRELARH